MDKKICTECKTENENEYNYCKNCGAPLQNEPQYTAEQPVNNSQIPPQSSPLPNVQQSDGSGIYQSPYTSAAAIDGIPVEDLHDFIGKKAPKILPKFLKMEFSHSKVSWCWPAAILGLLFGPMGSALWFFYRKMYKPALILLLIGTLLSFTVSALTAGTTQQATEIFNSIGDTQNIDWNDILSDFAKIGSENTLQSTIANSLQNIAELAACILTGLFGYYFYKKHCIEKISSLRQGGIDMRYYKMGLASVGGTSGGMLALGIGAIVLISILSSSISTILNLL